MSQPDWVDFPLKTSALGSNPDSTATSFKPPALLQASPPLTVAVELSQLFRVKKPFTLPENERSQAPAFIPISACAAPAQGESGRHGKRSLLVLHNSHHLYLLLESISSQPQKFCRTLNQRTISYSLCVPNVYSLHIPRQAFHN